MEKLKQKISIFAAVLTEIVKNIEKKKNYPPKSLKLSLNIEKLSKKNYHDADESTEEIKR